MKSWHHFSPPDLNITLNLTLNLKLNLCLNLSLNLNLNSLCNFCVYFPSYVYEDDTLNTFSDSALLGQLCEGKPQAMAQLYERYRTRLLRFSLTLLKNKQNAEDVVQNVFEKLQSECGTIRNGLSMQSWLFTVARNEAFGELRKRKGDALDEEMLWEGDLPDEELERKVQKERVQRVLENLHAPYREVIVLREYENMSYEEIAAVTKTSVSSVKSRLFHARKALIAKLKPIL